MHMTYRNETHRKLARNSGQIKSKLFWLERAIADDEPDEVRELLMDIEKKAREMFELTYEN